MSAGRPTPTLAPGQWQRVGEVFQAALELDPPERTAFLEQACAGDEAVRSEVERLLAAHVRAGDFMEGAAPDLAALLTEEDEPSAVGRQFGAYQVLRELGRGGMGAVYLAERADDEYRKQVAIKLIKRGMDTDAVLRHFRNERQILASLEHPHIARLIDGGTTDDGAPYFVMEYVEGLPIDQYCEEHALSIAERLQLFRQAGAAVSYAHQHLVVHRDIKPSNILVGPDGVPKLLDFGIGKILDPDAGGDLLPTATGLRLMTPEYASPEQVEGLPSTTLTDLYSLGVVLYELLTGRKPYELTNRLPHELAEVICSIEPERPSTVGPPRLRRGLRGDVDNIVLMALRKDPARRYRSVEHLCEDIQRHLDGRPVSARQETLGYRAGKFVRRNRMAVAAAALVLASLAGGVVATARQAHRARLQQALAERRFNDVRQLARAVLFDYHDAIKDLPGATPVRERLVKDGLAYLDTLAREEGSDGSLARELASAYERVGDVQGDPLSANLGDTAGALQSYRKALAIRDRLRAATPGSPVARRELAQSHLKLGLLQSETGEVSGATGHNDQATAILEALLSEHPADEALRYELAFAQDRAGTVSLDAGEVGRALRQHRRAIELYESLAEAQRESPKVRRELSAAYGRLSQALIETADLEEALLYNRKGLVLRAALGAAFPLNTDYLRAVGGSHYSDGDILSRMGRHREALGAFGKSAAIGEKLLAGDPRSGEYRSGLAYGLLRVGESLGRLGRHAEALSNLRKSLALRVADVAADPMSLWKRTSLIEAHAKTGLTLARMGQRSAALAACDEALSLMGQTAVEPANVVVAGTFAQIDIALGEAYVTLASDRSAPEGQRREWWRQARKVYGRSHDVWEDLRARGLLSTIDAGQPEALARQVAKCDAALARMR